MNSGTDLKLNVELKSGINACLTKILKELVMLETATIYTRINIEIIKNFAEIQDLTNQIKIDVHNSNSVVQFKKKYEQLNKDYFLNFKLLQINKISKAKFTKNIDESIGEFRKTFYSL